jgi:NAD+ synthase
MFDAKKVKDELIEWIREYFKNNGSEETKAVIGISGGKDSSVVAALCVEALGKDRVFGVLMPQGEQADIDVSYALCKHLGIPHTVINIEGAVYDVLAGLKKAGLELTTVTTFNTPARIRMATLYAVSGSIGGRVANTCNLSEDWVGYVTKFGDAAGDFSPLSNLTVTEVKAIGRELGLPAVFVDKVPIDGLCGKTDEDNLGFTYDTLDKYIRDGIEPDAETKAKIDRLHAMNLHKLNLMPSYKPSNL